MTDSSEKSPLEHGVVIEFDYAALPGHALLQKCCAERLARDGVQLDTVLMAKYLYGKAFPDGIAELFKRREIEADAQAAAEDCRAAFEQALAGAIDKMPASFPPFVKSLTSKGLRVVIVSRIPEAALKERFKGIQSPLLIFQQDVMSGIGSFNFDAWRRIARNNGIHDRLALAVVASGISCRNALICGMSVVAKPDALTEYQDFGGCDRMVDDFSAALATDIAGILRV